MRYPCVLGASFCRDAASPVLAVDFSYPPGPLGVEAHPLHLVAEPRVHVGSCRERSYRGGSGGMGVLLVVGVSDSSGKLMGGSSE